METKIEKSKLLNTLKSNLQTHKDFYEEAIKSYRVKTSALLRLRAEELKNGKEIPYTIPQAPSSHYDEYRKIIKMVEFDSREQITLSEHEFTQYIMDEWAWKLGWESNLSQYVDLKKFE